MTLPKVSESRLSFSFMVLTIMIVCPFLHIDGAQTPSSAGSNPERVQTNAAYTLGPEDEISIWAFRGEEFNGKTFRIDRDGNISLPLIGPVRAAGMTTSALETELIRRLRTYIVEPQVSVTVTAFNSQPVSIIGAVAKPGMQQLRGGKTLLDLLTLSGGLTPAAAPYAKIVRQLAVGTLPLPQAREDAAAGVSSADVNLKSLLSATNPQENIPLMAGDVVMVPIAQAIYVVGDVVRPGQVNITEQETMTVLQVLSLVGGVTPTSAPNKAKILRPTKVGPERTEIPVDIKAIFAGKMQDVPLMANDILFVPDSKGKKFASFATSTAVSLGISALLYGVIM